MIIPLCWGPKSKLPLCLLYFGHVPVLNGVIYCQIKENVSHLLVEKPFVLVFSCKPYTVFHLMFIRDVWELPDWHECCGVISHWSAKIWLMNYLSTVLTIISQIMLVVRGLNWVTQLEGVIVVTYWLWHGLCTHWHIYNALLTPMDTGCFSQHFLHLTWEAAIFRVDSDVFSQKCFNY